MKKSILKRIGLIALAVCVAIGSFFVPVSNKQLNSASANSTIESYTFDGSNVYIPFFRDDLSVGGDGLTNYLDTAVFNINFTCSSSTLTLDLDGSELFYFNNQYGDSNFLVYTLFFGSLNLDGSLSNQSTTLSLPINDYILVTPVYLGSFSGNGSWRATYTMYVHVPSSDFNGNISYIDFGNDTLPLMSGTVYINYIRYYDVNNNYIQFSFPLLPDYVATDSFDFRTYYITDNFTDSQIYQQGYKQGLADNQQKIYDNGYNAGYDIGFGNGKTTGMAEANDFSFISLIGAVVDVPVQTFLGLFEFELLGINLANFFLSLLTVAVIIFVIKLVIGGK